MPSLSVADFVETLRSARILTLDQSAEAGKLQPRFTDARAFAKDMMTRGWLTPFQINQIFQGQAAKLILGSYVLLDRIGEGAMGLVYKARHQTMGRIVAVKVIRKERLSHPNAIKRFQREIRAMAQLSHPNVITAYDADQVNGTHFYAMEFVDGIDLGKMVKQSGQLPVVAACDFVRQAAMCLQHAHERGMVHRDIKPSNLLLARTGSSLDGFGTIKVLDMGLARLSEAGDESSQLTKEGIMMGTPDFLAPEQARDSHRVDIRSDLYSLGCTFYYILTAQVPYPSSNLTQKLLMHRSAPLPNVQAIRPEVPAPVSAVVKKLLAKAPEERYQMPADVVRDLTHILTTGSLPATASAAAHVKGAHDAPAPIIPMGLPVKRSKPNLPVAEPVAVAEPVMAQPVGGGQVFENFGRGQHLSFESVFDFVGNNWRSLAIGLGAFLGFIVLLLLASRLVGAVAERPKPRVQSIRAELRLRPVELRLRPVELDPSPDKESQSWSCAERPSRPRFSS